MTIAPDLVLSQKSVCIITTIITTTTTTATTQTVPHILIFENYLVSVFRLFRKSFFVRRYDCRFELIKFLKSDQNYDFKGTMVEFFEMIAY